MKDLHKIQMQILRELLFHPNSRFSDLNISGLSNDHFSYHIKTLLELGLVTKKSDRYSLTLEGKEFANRIDTDKNVIEKQPKISVLIIPELYIDGKLMYAIQTRLKEPYYGFMGFMSGKMRYGETVFEAAARELDEEMGMTAQFEHLYILHEMVYDMTGNMLEDKFFNVVRAHSVGGILKPKHESGTNKWMTEEEFYAASPKFHNEEEILEWAKGQDHSFKEKKYFIESF